MYAKDYNITVHDVIKQVKHHADTQPNNQVTLHTVTHIIIIVLTYSFLRVF